MEKKKFTLLFLFTLVGLLLMGIVNPMMASASSSKSDDPRTWTKKSPLIMGVGGKKWIYVNDVPIYFQYGYRDVSAKASNNNVQLKRTKYKMSDGEPRSKVEIKGKKEGTTKLTVTFYNPNKKNAPKKSTVTAYVKVVKYKMNVTKKTLYVGQTINLNFCQNINYGSGYFGDCYIGNERYGRYGKYSKDYMSYTPKHNFEYISVYGYYSDIEEGSYINNIKVKALKPTKKNKPIKITLKTQFGQKGVCEITVKPKLGC